MKTFIITISRAKGTILVNSSSRNRNFSGRFCFIFFSRAAFFALFFIVRSKRLGRFSLIQIASPTLPFSRALLTYAISMLHHDISQQIR
jgi:hypothetical protein